MGRRLTTKQLQPSADGEQSAKSIIPVQPIRHLPKQQRRPQQLILQRAVFGEQQEQQLRNSADIREFRQKHRFFKIAQLPRQFFFKSYGAATAGQRRAAILLRWTRRAWWDWRTQSSWFWRHICERCEPSQILALHDGKWAPS